MREWAKLDKFRFTGDTAYSIMDRKALDRAWAVLLTARRSPQTADDLEAVAKLCGRRMQPGGNHPMWVTDHHPHRPIPIGRHGGNRELPPHVKKVILNGLAADLAAWEDVVSHEEANDQNGGRSDGR
jgi:hypothetical protein